MGNSVVDEYKDIEKKDEVIRGVRKLRRKFFRYKEAEYVYSIEHKKLLELADRAGAIYRVDGFVLLNREIFETYLERFHQPPKMTKTGGKKS